MKTISLTFEKIGTVSYKDDNYTNQYIYWDHIPQQYINKLVLEHYSDIKLLQELFDKLEEKKLKNEIYFNGQIK